jgi:hypothetical protein
MKRRDIRGSIQAHRPLRRLFIEGLESRAVMSVCGVTCELTDGMLSVQGTPDDDLIAVRYDAEAASVSVVGRNEEVIAQYPLADVRGLDINGLGGNDLLHVDSSLHDALGMNAAEGENSAASSGNTHSHGSATSTNNTTSTSFSGFGPALTPSLAPSLNSLSVSNTAASPLNSTSSANLSVTATVGDHSAYHDAVAHIAAPVDAGIVAHASHYSPAAGAVISLMSSAVSVAGHSHVAADYHSAAASGGETMSEVHAASPAEGFSGELKDGEHDKHETTVTTSVAFNKLISKPCTVSYSGGLVVTAVNGKRECGCDQKKQAAEEVKQQLAGKEGMGADGLAAAAVECVPCQQQSGIFAGGLLKEFQTCSAPMAAAKQAITLPVLTLLDEHHGASCLTRSAAEDAALTETAWLESLQYVGWPLVAAATAALVPSRLERRKKHDEEDDAPALDWLFGRLQVEPLLAR